jgi:hypothetical protein
MIAREMIPTRRCAPRVPLPGGDTAQAAARLAPRRPHRSGLAPARVRVTGLRLSGLRLTGLRLSGLLLSGLLSAGCMAERDSSGEIVTAGIVGVFQLLEGDCFNDPKKGDDADTLARVDGVPCTEPHHNETYAVFELALDAWPGDDAMTEIALQECMTRFERYVGTRYTPQSQLDFLPLFPSEESFSADDRGVICFLYDRRNEKLSGSMRGRGA